MGIIKHDNTTKPLLIVREIPHTLLTYIPPWYYHRDTRTELDDDVGGRRLR